MPLRCCTPATLKPHRASIHRGVHSPLSQYATDDYGPRATLKQFVGATPEA